MEKFMRIRSLYLVYMAGPTLHSHLSLFLCLSLWNWVCAWLKMTKLCGTVWLPPTFPEFWVSHNPWDLGFQKQITSSAEQKAPELVLTAKCVWLLMSINWPACVLMSARVTAFNKQNNRTISNQWKAFSKWKVFVFKC